MRFFQVVISGAALLSAAMADVAFTKVPTSVQAGQSVDLEWSATGTGPITILLRKGPADNLGAGQTLTTTGANGKFTWAVPASLVNAADYAFEIKQGSDNNFSGQFAVSGGTGQASSASATPVSSTASSPKASTTITASVSSSVSEKASSTPLSSSASSNGTVTSATLSSTARSTARQTGSSTGSANVPESTGAASTLVTSPLALIFGAVAAMAYLN